MTTVPKVSNFLQKIRKADWTPLLLIWALAVFYCFFCHYLQISALGHTGYYTYTLQALAWRNGQIALHPLFTYDRTKGLVRTGNTLRDRTKWERNGGSMEWM